MRIAVLLVYCCCLGQLSAQDTLVTWFDANSARVSEQDQATLRNLSAWYDAAQIDSVHFIGYVNSTEEPKSARRLTESRLTNLQKACRFFLEPQTPFSNLVLDDIDSTQQTKELIVFFYPKPTGITTAGEIIENKNSKCFLVDFEALEYCHMTTFNLGTQSYVQLEALNIPLFKERKHYYVVTGSAEKATIVRLNWKLKTTGRLWWKKERWVATLPKESFEKFQIFTLINAPCSACPDSIFTKDTVLLTNERYYPDLFLMDNMQAKIRVFGGNKTKIRAPREYVDITENYYFGTSAYTSNGNSPIVWTEKRGPNKENYYYSTLNNRSSGAFYIKKSAATAPCLHKYEYGMYQRSWTSRGYVNPHGKPVVSFRITPGAFFHNDTLTAFATAGINIKGFCISGGMTHRGGIYASVYYNRGILSLTILPMSPKNKWQSLNQSPRTRKYLVFYAGGDVRSSFTRTYTSFIEGNVHLGTRLWYHGSSRMRLTFVLQGGLAYDFSKHINTKPYPYAEFGLHFDLPIVRG